MDLFTADLNRLTNDDLYLAIADLARTQPGESYRHDFKESWSNDTLKDVAGFANTFGGILVIGVSKGQREVEARLVGQRSGSELCTAIASSVATNISPTPSYDVAECHKPGDTNKRFCVVRISNDSSLHVVTKKDISTRVFVRNVDQTIPADGAQLRMMIDREKHSAISSSDDSFYQRGFFLLNQMPIGRGFGSLGNWTAGLGRPSGTYFKLALIPAEHRVTPLDRRTEKQFLASIHDNYRRVRSLSGAGKVAATAENRSDDFYQYQWYHSNLDYECRWRITKFLEVAHSTQIKEDDRWSLLDAVAYVILMLRVSAKWWESLHNFGDGVLCAILGVESLELARGKSGQFIKLFGPGAGDFALRPEVLDVGQQQLVVAQVGVPVNFAEMRSDIPEIVTSVMNSLLRTLGHGVSWAEFREDVGIIANGMQ
ncbi:MAG: ATP-binding protein [Terracidiphilus sp.]